MSNDPRHTLGKLGEDLAESHLIGLGYTILARNFRTRSGEIDLVACDDDEIVFVEVRTKHHTEFGHPFDTITLRKQQKLIKMARLYLQGGPLPPALAAKRNAIFCRFDVIGIIIDEPGEPILEHLKNAFSA